MKAFLSLIALLWLNITFGQAQDKRAKLDINARIKEISLSPNGSIWLVTAMGDIHYTMNLDSNWHTQKEIFQPTDSLRYNKPDLDRISFFNKDTALITGFITSQQDLNKTSGFYRTTDGGKTWALLNYGGDSWIYTTHIGDKGNVWMGGSSKELYYSSDFGQSWKTIKVNYKVSNRTYSLYMIDYQNGIAGSNNGEIVTTTNNWKSIKFLPSPLSQKKYQVETDDYVDKRIEKILKWKDYIVINQCGHIYYSHSSKIEWKDFSIRLENFELEKETQKLFAITSDLKLAVFDSPSDFQLSDHSLKTYPIDIKIADHSLFALTNNYAIEKISLENFKHTTPYTTDKPIAQPEIIRPTHNYLWGMTDNQIYLSDNQGASWYREAELHFKVVDFVLLNDSTAVLWNGKNSYLYSLNTHTCNTYTIENPLQHFLNSPIKTLSIDSGSSGCYHFVSSSITYNSTVDGFLVADSVKKYNESFQAILDKTIDQALSFKNKVKIDILKSALEEINTKPLYIPALSEFEITSQDCINYQDWIKRLQEQGSINGKNNRFYASIPLILDTIKNIDIKQVVDNRTIGWSTTSDWFTIYIVNSKSDTITITRNSYEDFAWNIPWTFTYNGIHFNCYNIAFTKLIASYIPNTFYGYQVFDNKYLILAIARFLERKKRRKL